MLVKSLDETTRSGPRLDTFRSTFFSIFQIHRHLRFGWTKEPTGNAGRSDHAGCWGRWSSVRCSQVLELFHSKYPDEPVDLEDREGGGGGGPHPLSGVRKTGLGLESHGVGSASNSQMRCLNRSTVTNYSWQFDTSFARAISL